MDAAYHHKATPHQVAAFSALTPERRADFWRMVLLELLKYRVQFSNLILKGDGVTFTDSVMVDSAITGPEFLQRLSFVGSGARLYLELLLELYDASESSVATAPVTGQSL